MSNLASLFEAPEAAQSAATATHIDDGAQLLELRTENGAVYLLPSRWQRIRLQWTFRHFRVLSSQVLSRADNRLIEKLSQSAVVTPALPLAPKTILGVVETVRSKAPAAANRVVTLQPGLQAKHVLPAKPPGLPRPNSSAVLRRTTRFPGGKRAWDFGAFRFRQWRHLVALAVFGFMVILASVYRAPLVSSTVQLWSPRTRIEPAANNTKPPKLHTPAISPLLISPAGAWVANTEKPKRWTAPPPLEPEPGAQAAPVEAGSAAPGLDTIPDTAAAALSAASARRFVVQLPPGYFAHPVVSGGNPVGELQLKALIGANGSVKEVTVLSGSRKLAQAGVRAVRQWHYSPYLVQGSPVEVETQIRMSFFGPDAVSIASVANGSTSQPK